MASRFGTAPINRGVENRATTLMASIMAGVSEDPPWGSFIVQMRHLLGGNYANVIFRRPDLRRSVETFDGDIRIEGIKDAYYRQYAQLDPIPYYRLEPGRAYCIEEFLDDADIRRSPFCSQFLLPRGIAQFMICKAGAKPGERAWLTITRSDDAPKFTPLDRKRLERIAHLFAPALSLYTQLKTIEGERDAFARIACGRATHVLRLDQNGCLIGNDPETSRWLGEVSQCLRMRHGKLRAVSTLDAQQLDAAIAQLLGNEDMASGLALAIGLQCGLDLLLQKVGSPIDGLTESSPRILIYATQRNRNRLSVPRLRSLFNLSQREAELTELLCSGTSLATSAERIGITEQTARAYSKQIFQKTGTNRQAELVWRVLSSVAAID